LSFKKDIFTVEKKKHNIYHILMKKSCLYFDKKYKCASFIDHYKGLTLIRFTGHVVGAIMLALEKSYTPVK